MMVVTVMAVALHLIQKLRENPLPCQIRDCHPAGKPIKLPTAYAFAPSSFGCAGNGDSCFCNRSTTCWYKRLRSSNLSDARVT